MAAQSHHEYVEMLFHKLHYIVDFMLDTEKAERGRQVTKQFTWISSYNLVPTSRTIDSTPPMPPLVDERVGGWAGDWLGDWAGGGAMWIRWGD
jgi:hypothetical protein